MIRNPYDELSQFYDAFQGGRDQDLLAELQAMVGQIEQERKWPRLSLAEEIAQVQSAKFLLAEEKEETEAEIAEKAAFKAMNIPLAIDLGCGSGRVSQALLEQGWRVLGVDLSIEQIKLADERAFAWEDAQWQRVEAEFLERYGEDAYLATRQAVRRYSYHVADLLEVDLSGLQADLALCWLDTFNHLPKTSWLTFCQHIARGLKDGAYFIFDYLTPEYMEKYYANQTYEEVLGSQKLKWKNEWNAKTNKNIAHLQLVSTRGHRSFTIEETALRPEEAQALLEKAGFVIKDNRPSRTQKERYIICARYK